MSIPRVRADARKSRNLKSHIFQAWKVLESGLGHGKSWKCK